MFQVTDTYGTRRNCWTWASALSWLAAASPNAHICNRITGRVIATRIQTRTY